MPFRSAELKRVQPRFVRCLECFLLIVQRMFPRCATATLTTAIAFMGYLGVEALVVAIGAYTPEYAFATLADPVFILLGTALGTLTCLTMGSLVVLAWFCNTEDPRTPFVITLGFIGLVCGVPSFGSRSPRVSRVSLRY